MAVAHKYNVLSLVNLCSKIIIARLNEDNAIQAAVMGELYNMPGLEKAAKAVITASSKFLMTMIKDSGFKLQDR